MRKHVLWVAVLAAACAKKPEKTKDPGLVTMEGSLGAELVPDNAGGEVVARLHISGAEVARVGRQPINLALVIDTSGSMEGDAIVHARAAATALVDQLRDSDKLAVVVFHSRAEVVAPSGKVGGRRSAIKQAIAKIEARGTTDLAGGLATGVGQVMNGFLPGGVNRIVLLGDGVANDPSSLPGIAQSAAAQGVAITALGLGLDYDETQLAALAKASGGTFHFIDDAAQVKQVFADEVLRLHRSVARNVQLTLTPGPGVSITQVAGLPQPPPGPAYYNLGDLAEGEQRDIIVRLTTPPRARGVIELVDAVLAFDDASRGAGRFERRAYLAVHPSADEAAVEKSRNLDVLRAAAHAQAADDVLRALAMARAGDEAGARSTLDNSEKITLLASTTLEDASLRTRAEDARKLGESLPAVLAYRPPPAPRVQGVGGGAAADQASTPAATQARLPQAAPVADPAAAENIRRIHDMANDTLQTHK